ncbi:MAG TPA: hypothetical protein VGR25_01310 [bacterium]|nr:hypothetical protein [bacterium]
MVAAAVLIAALAAGAVPARAEADARLTRALGSVFRAEVLRIDAVPDLYEGGYARISVYARRARVASGGPVIDEAWTRLRGVTLNAAELRRGSFDVESTRSTAIYLRVSLRSLERYFAANDYEDIRLWSDGAAVYGTGMVPVFNNRRTRVEMKGAFAVEGTKDLFFHVESLRVNGFPVPEPLLRWLEKKFNPILGQQDWPVIYTFRSVRLTREDVIVSSETDPTVCSFCADVRPER